MICGWDYCLAEVKRYEKAKELGIEKSFLKTFYVGDINGYPVYAQEKVDFSSNNADSIVDRCKHKKVKRYIKKIGGALEEWILLRNPVEDDWGIETFKYYGFQYCKKLFSFIDDENINDLHSSNIGYLKGHPVLMDYAGWYDDN